MGKFDRAAQGYKVKENFYGDHGTAYAETAEEAVRRAAGLDVETKGGEADG